MIAEALPGAEGVSGVEIAVDMTQRHERPTFTIDAAVAWQWLDDGARERDAIVRAALLAL